MYASNMTRKRKDKSFAALRGGVFVSRLLRVVYAAGSKKQNAKKHTELESVQLWGTTEHASEPYTHITRQETHWTQESAVLKYH